MQESGVFRGEKIEYHDGIGCCIWIPFSILLDDENESDDAGLCWDFGFEDIDDLINLLEKLKKVEAEVYIEE